MFPFVISLFAGCASVQRILSEFIPRYGSFCPTALEAAAQVVINMHNWSVPVISRGEDADGVLFETAQNCVSGLVDICCIASKEAPTSSVIQGICSAVFLNAVTFFASSVDGKDIFQIIDKEGLRMQASAEMYNLLKQRILEEEASSLFKLLKFRALSCLRIFFLCPKDVLAACFELFNTRSADGICREGTYFLAQLCCAVNTDDYSYSSMNGDNVQSEDCTGCKGSFDLKKDEKSAGDKAIGNKKGLLKSCLLGMVRFLVDICPYLSSLSPFYVGLFFKVPSKISKAIEWWIENRVKTFRFWTCRYSIMMLKLYEIVNLSLSKNVLVNENLQLGSMVGSIYF